MNPYPLPAATPFATRGSIQSLPARQRGAVLILALVMLLLLTFMGVAAMNTARMQEKMVGNLQDAQVAFEMAELALRAGENWLSAAGDPAASDSPGSGQIFAQGARDPGWWRDFDWDHDAVQAVNLNANLVRDGDGATSWYVRDEPRFVIGEVGTVRTDDAAADAASYVLYQVTALGFGGRENTQVVLESTYAIQR